MKRCPTCQATFPDATERCPKDGAKLAAMSVTMGWDAVEAPAEASPAPAKPAPKPASVTAGWDVPDVPEEAPAPAATAMPAMPTERPQTPMKSSPVARKTLFGMGVVTELDATGEDGDAGSSPAAAASTSTPEQERPTMAYPAAAPASAIYEAVTYEPGPDESEPAAAPVDLAALATAATQTAIPGDLGFAATAPTPVIPPPAVVPPAVAPVAVAPPERRRASTVGEPVSGNRTFVIVLVVALVIAAGVAAALLLS